MVENSYAATNIQGEIYPTFISFFFLSDDPHTTHRRPHHPHPHNGRPRHSSNNNIFDDNNNLDNRIPSIISNSIEEATAEVDAAINRTIAALHARGTPKSPGDLMALMRFPEARFHILLTMS